MEGAGQDEKRMAGRVFEKEKVQLNSKLTTQVGPYSYTNQEAFKTSLKHWVSYKTVFNLNYEDSGRQL